MELAVRPSSCCAVIFWPCLSLIVQRSSVSSKQVEVTSCRSSNRAGCFDGCDLGSARLIMAYTELTVWTRGIIMDKEGRDIVNSISASARLEGKYAQAMENYVDNPDRTNCPTRKYCRVSDHVIENELTYENEQPNIIVLVEGTMVKGWDYMRGMPPGGTLVINTH